MAFNGHFQILPIKMWYNDCYNNFQKKTEGRCGMKIIVVDDEEKIRKQLLKIINQTIFKLDSNIQVMVFDKYSKELKKEMRNNDGNIYILDIDLPGKSGFDLSREIRFEENDWKSIIIIISAYDQKSDFISSQLLIFTYISKFIDFDNNLKNSINLALKILLQFKTFENNNKRRIIVSDILYIQKEKGTKYSLIKTINGEYRIRKNLNELEKELCLKRIKKELLINKKNIISISKNEIVFKNNIKINY